MKLVEVSRTSLASTFGIECETCKRKKDKVRQYIYYLRRQYEEEKTRDRYVAIANEKAKLAKLQTSLNDKHVHSIRNQKNQTGVGTSHILFIMRSMLRQM